MNRPRGQLAPEPVRQFPVRSTNLLSAESPSGSTASVATYSSTVAWPNSRPTATSWASPAIPPSSTRHSLRVLRTTSRSEIWRSDACLSRRPHGSSPPMTSDGPAMCCAQSSTETGGRDGRVSIEVDPRAASDTTKTIAEARALWWQVDRPNVMIKIPATRAGVPAITAATAEGISVNVTLIFGLDRYDSVMEAYLSGLEQAQAAGRDLSMIRSVASFFVSRVDTEVDERLGEIGTTEAAELRGRAGVANARLAYKRYRAVIDSPRWQQLVAAGAHVQRPLWASTGVKNPAYPDTLYVDNLIAVDTVSTMPKATLLAVQDHGRVTDDSISNYYGDASQVLSELADIGVDYHDVVNQLERDGVSKFVHAWTHLLDRLEESMATIASSQQATDPAVRGAHHDLVRRPIR